MIALVTARRLPEPDHDQPLLSGALNEANVAHEIAAWDDPAVDWSRYSAAVIRSTWNYHLHLASFLEFVDRASRQTVLRNPAPAVRRNAHKRYLLELASEQIATVPTVLVEAGDSFDVHANATSRGWESVVVKPAVSGGSYRTRSFPCSDPDAQLHLDGLASGGDVLVQQLLPAVVAEGERSLVFVEGRFGHCVNKLARFADDEETVRSCAAVADELELAHQALAALDASELLYARVDIARDTRGAACVMEVELIEPSLFFSHGPETLARFVAALATLT